MAQPPCISPELHACARVAEDTAADDDSKAAHQLQNTAKLVSHCRRRCCKKLWKLQSSAMLSRRLNSQKLAGCQSSCRSGCRFAWSDLLASQAAAACSMTRTFWHGKMYCTTCLPCGEVQESQEATASLQGQLDDAQQKLSTAHSALATAEESAGMADAKHQAALQKASISHWSYNAGLHAVPSLHPSTNPVRAQQQGSGMLSLPATACIWRTAQQRCRWGCCPLERRLCQPDGNIAEQCLAEQVLEADEALASTMAQLKEADTRHAPAAAHWPQPAQAMDHATSNGSGPDLPALQVQLCSYTSDLCAGQTSDARVCPAFQMAGGQWQVLLL